MPINPIYVLVVGGAGYIGSHMVLSLQDAGFYPIVLDNLTTGHRDAVPVHVPFIEADMSNAEALDRIFTAYPIAAVMHFASYVEVGESVAEPLKYYENNVAATLRLLKSMLKHDIKRIVFSSTAAVYGVPTVDLISEQHAIHPINPYGRSQWMVEEIIRDLAKSDAMHYAILRYFNAAGADPAGRLGERHIMESHLIPLILQVAAGVREHITVYGSGYATNDGTCIRDYVHVADICQAHLLALTKLLNNATEMTYNIGTGRGYSVLEVIAAVERVTGIPIKKVMGRARSGDPAILVADPAEAMEILNWHPHYPDLDCMIQHAWQYIRANEIVCQ